MTDRILEDSPCPLPTNPREIRTLHTAQEEEPSETEGEAKPEQNRSEAKAEAEVEAAKEARAA